jgi:hypothetical protein
MKTKSHSQLAYRVSGTLHGLVRPPVWLTAWVLRRVADHAQEGGTFRHLIYDRMGYGPKAYEPLLRAGGMAISNALYERAEAVETSRKLAKALSDAISTYRGKDCVVTEDRIEAWEAVLKHE